MERLHHKGRNKHHHQYWVDLSIPEKTIIMPYKYAAEMVCDELAAGIVYNGLDATLTKQNIKKLYEKYCIRMENLDENQI